MRGSLTASPSVPGQLELTAGELTNARIIAELQAVAIGINLVGLDRLPEVMTARKQAAQPDTPTPGYAAAEPRSPLKNPNPERETG